MPPPTERDAADRVARSVLRTRLGIRPKENVTIEAYPSALPWARGFVREARRAGARPLLHLEDEDAFWTAIQEGDAALIGTLAEHERAALESTDVYIYFWGPEHVARRWALPADVQRRLTAYNIDWYKVARRRGVRGARMAIARVTPGNAATFGVPLTAWRRELIEASSRDPANAIRLARRYRPLLEGGSTVHITHPNGTDLTLALAHRTMRESLGRVTSVEQKTAFGMMANVPESLIYVTVDESTADGTLVANRPTWSGQNARIGGRWKFEQGQLASFRYTRGGRSVRAAFRGASGDKDRPSLLELGLDPSLRVSPLLEESQAGVVSVAVGENVDWGGKNKSSFVEWLSLAGATVSLGGRTIVRHGRLR